MATLFYKQWRYLPKQRIAYSLIVYGLFFLVLTSGCSVFGTSAQPLSGHIRVAGSTALLPLASAAAQLFEKQHPQVKIDVAGIGSVKGLQAVTGHQAEIGTSDIYADPALYPDPNLTDHIVCAIPFAMIVNSRVTLPSLTQQQIIDIFSTGKYHNWQELNGPDLPIVPVVRPATSGTRDTFRKYVLEGRDEDPHNTPLKTDVSTDVRNRVATTPGAIGYLALPVVNKSVHMLEINGKAPTATNIEAGNYVFWSYEHMYTLGDDANAVVQQFLDFMQTDQIKQLEKRLQYIPTDNLQLPTLKAPTPGSENATTLLATGENRQAYRHE